MRVAYQGIAGSYSEAALFRHFGREVEPVSKETFEDVYSAIEDKSADAGILPFENSLAGSITRNYDLILKHDVQVIAEVYLPVKHHLLGIKGAKLQDIKRVFSHMQALDQCRDFIKERGFRSVPDYDTAGAACHIAERKSKEEAAIASRLAAEIYGLDILKDDITSIRNTTKFFVLTRPDQIPQGMTKEKTSIVFRTKHFPGALVHSLERLSKNNLNMTKLESRPAPNEPGEYHFFTDFMGGEEDLAVKRALSELEATSVYLRVLGSYPEGKRET